MMSFVKFFIQLSKKSFADYASFVKTSRYTLAKFEIIYPKDVRAKVAMDFT